MLAGVVWMSCRLCAVVTLDNVSEFTEDAHWQVPQFPADFRWNIKNQQAVNADLICIRIADVMNVKRVTVTGVVIERRRRLDVNAVREGKPCACLPCQHVRVRERNFLVCLTTGLVRRERWIRPNRVLGILVVINELRSVDEEVELQFERLSGRCDNGLTFLAVPSFTVRLNGFAATSATNVKSKRVLPLLRETFRIDVVVPQHRRGYERLWHSAPGKLDIRETRVTEISLADEDSVVPF